MTASGNPMLKRSIRNRFPYIARSTIYRSNCCNGTAAERATNGAARDPSDDQWGGGWVEE